MMPTYYIPISEGLIRERLFLAFAAGGCIFGSKAASLDNYFIGIFARTFAEEILVVVATITLMMPT
jgi:hypothetical protein